MNRAAPILCGLLLVWPLTTATPVIAPQTVHKPVNRHDCQGRLKLEVWTDETCGPCVRFWSDYHRPATRDFAEALNQVFCIHPIRVAEHATAAKRNRIVNLPTFMAQTPAGQWRRIEGYEGRAWLLNQLGIRGRPAADPVPPARGTPPATDSTLERLQRELDEMRRQAAQETARLQRELASAQADANRRAEDLARIAAEQASQAARAQARERTWKQRLAEAAKHKADQVAEDHRLPLIPRLGLKALAWKVGLPATLITTAASAGLWLYRRRQRRRSPRDSPPDVVSEPSAGPPPSGTPDYSKALRELEGKVTKLSEITSSLNRNRETRTTIGPVVQSDGSTQEETQPREPTPKTTEGLYRKAVDLAAQGKIVALGGPLLARAIKRWVADTSARQRGDI